MPSSSPRYLALLAIFGSIFHTLTGNAQAQTPPTRILPLGDSITFGSSVLGGYRNRLYSLLTTAGYNVDFVGTQTGNGVASLPDSDHQGIGGWRIDQVDTDISKWYNIIADPDVILLHIGTNDFGQNLDTANAINRWDALILKLATLYPKAHIIATNLMERTGTANAPIVAQFNPQVQTRIAAHQAAGRRVYFLDMRAAVPLLEMADGLHPNQIGYDHMADAWAPAVQSIISPLGDALPPGAKARASADRTQVTVTFSKPVADTAAAVGNFTLTPNLGILNASLDASKRIVTLTTQPQAAGTAYDLGISGVSDRLTPTPNPVPPGTSVRFYTPGSRGYAANIPEAGQYSLVYSLDIPTAATYQSTLPAYSQDFANRYGPISRVAYYLELQAVNGPLQYVWVSMPSFTPDAAKTGVPTVLSGAQFQTGVTGMNIWSNVAGLSSGTNLAGQVEFWPNTYNAVNFANVSGANSTDYDFGDQMTTGNYGSMQIHNLTNAQTVFAFNNWGTAVTTSGDVDLGIGNAPAPVNGGKDWTFAKNGIFYTIKTLQVLVATDSDLSPPSVVSAVAQYNRTQITITFSEPVRPETVRSSAFSLNGISVLAATLSANQREVVLTTSLQPSNTAMTLGIQGVRDTSCHANLLPTQSLTVNPASALPPEVQANVGATANGYVPVYSIDIPVTGNFNAAGASAFKYDDHLAPGGFSRVAYYLELQTGASTQYVWASMDAFTASKGKVGLPLLSNGAIFQRDVANLEVKSNVAGVVNGTTATGGNIEFWPNSYTVANGLAVANASATTYDIGDTVTGTVPTAGYGCLQIHRHDTGSSQTVLAVNRFGTDAQILDVGIGNNPAPTSNGVDWTFASNAGNFTKRTLHVLVLPSANYLTPAAVTTNVGAAANGYQLVYTLPIPASGNVTSLVYSVNNALDVVGMSKIAYYMELQTGAATPEWVWTSMDAFTQDARKIGLPTTASAAIWQIPVTNMQVLSNVSRVTTGTFPTGGNLEFWPTNYSAPNAANVPGASATLNDFGDTRSTTGTHGSMQVHNSGALQTVWGMSNWGATTGTLNYALGIGNDPNTARATYHPDWTFAANSATYSNRLLHVFAIPVGSPPDTTGPVASSITPSSNLARCLVNFSEPIAEDATDISHFSFSGGLQVLRADFVTPSQLALTTSAQTPGTAYILSYTGIRDRSSNANANLPGATATFTAWNAPALFASVPEAATYQLLYALPVPTVALYNTNAVPYTVDEGKFPQASPVERAAYVMELTSGGVTSWVSASFDSPSPEISKLGVPTLASGAIFQQNVTNMNVSGSVGAPFGTVNMGTGLTGNIEFWPHNYTAALSPISPTNASAVNFDFGDTRSTTGTHGSMQIHNASASQTIMAYNNWGGSGGNSALGLGNDPAPILNGTNLGVDWTFHTNAATYTTRNLYVFGRLSSTPSVSSLTVLSQPCSQYVSDNQPVTLAALSASNNQTQQWFKNGQPVPGATSPWLELGPITAANEGIYTCVINGALGATSTTAPANIFRNVPPSVLQTSFNPQGNVLNLSFRGTPTKRYLVEKSPDLGTWDTLGTPTADISGVVSQPDAAPAPNRGFYRMSELP